MWEDDQHIIRMMIIVKSETCLLLLHINIHDGWMSGVRMSISFQPTRLVGAIAIMMGFTSIAFAQDHTNKTVSLDTIVVTASRTEQKIKDVPARISIGRSQ